MKRRWLSAKEVAEELGVHEDTIYRAHLQKRIPVQRVSKVLRFDLEKVLKALAKNQTTRSTRRKGLPRPPAIAGGAHSRKAPAR